MPAGNYPVPTDVSKHLRLKTLVIRDEPTRRTPRSATASAPFLEHNAANERRKSRLRSFRTVKSRFVHTQTSKRPLTCGNTVPEVGIEPDSGPCKHWAPAETCRIPPSPPPVQPDPKPSVCTLCTSLFLLCGSTPADASDHPNHHDEEPVPTWPSHDIRPSIEGPYTSPVPFHPPAISYLAHGALDVTGHDRTDRTRGPTKQ